jgi:hypothetical protein
MSLTAAVWTLVGQERWLVEADLPFPVLRVLPPAAPPRAADAFEKAGNGAYVLVLSCAL